MSESKEIDCPIYTIVRYIAMDVKFFSDSATYFNGSSLETTGTVFNDTQETNPFPRMHRSR